MICQAGRTPLQLVCYYSDCPKQVVEFLVQHGASLHSTTCVSQFSLEMDNFINLLLSQRDETPFHLVCGHGKNNIETVKFLVEHGANVYALSKGIE